MKKLILVVAFLLFSSTVHASLIEIDDVVFGQNSITHDTVTNLDWLDLTVTTNQSFNQVSTRLTDQTDSLFGFRYATSSELSILFFTSANITSGSQSPPEVAVDDLISLMGLTLYGSLYETRQTRGYYDTGSIVNGNTGWAFLSTSVVLDYSSVGITANAASATLQSNSNGSWLVRDANPVPEPTTIALLGIGLVGMAGAEVRRRRKKNAVDNS